MARDVTELSVLISSPSDLQIERGIAENAIKAANRLLAFDYSITLRALRWEDLPSEIGPHPQVTINKRLDDYDIFIGLMGSRFGTPTTNAESGTEEEFNNALKKYNKDQSSIYILFYFSGKAIKPDTNADQLKKVQLFKESIRGLYKIFNSSEELYSSLLNDLMAHTIEWAQTHKKKQIHNVIINENISIKDDVSLKIIEATSKEEGPLEHLEMIEESLHNIREAILTITRGIMDVNLDSRRTIDELNKLSAKPLQYRTKAAMRILNKNANAIEDYTIITKENLPIFVNSWRLFADRSIQLLSLAREIKQDNIEEIKENYLKTLKLCKQMKDAENSLEQYAKSIQEIPGMTNKYKRVKNGAIDITKQLITSIGDGREKLTKLIDAYKDEIKILTPS